MAGMACNLHRAVMPLINRPFRFFSPGDELYFRWEGVHHSNELTPEDPVTLFDHRAKSCQPLEYKIPPMNPNERVPR